MIMSLKKPNCLTLHEKSLVIHELNNGASVTSLSKKYRVAKSTICKIKNQKQTILSAVYVGPGQRRTLKGSKLPRMEEHLYKWFLDQRSKNMTITGELLKQKAKSLHSELKETCKGFTASEGWLQKFKLRFGIRFPKIAREKLASQPQIVDPFKRQIKQDGMQEHCQLYNAEESGLYWKLLPEITFVTSSQAVASGNKTDQSEPGVLEWNSADNHCETPDNKNRTDEVEVSYQEISRTVTADNAISAFNVVIDWAAGHSVDNTDINVLKRLRGKAVLERIEKVKKQKKITDYFTKQ